jgi:hypothetical protein
MLPTKRQTRDFQVTLVLEELKQFPLSHGNIFAKWKLQPQVANPHFGFTSKSQVIRNTVTWNETFTFSVKFGAAGERGEEIRSCGLRISIREEKSSSLGHIRHGIVELDLAEYAGLPSLRKNFLLQESRTNAVLSLSLTLRQISGDPTFKRPLKSVTVALPDRSSVSVTQQQQSNLDSDIDRRKTESDWVDMESSFVDATTAEKNFFHILESNADSLLDAGSISETEEQLELEIPAYVRATRIDAEALIEKIVRDVIPNKERGGDMERKKEEINSDKVRESQSDKGTNEMEDSGNHGHDLDISLLKRTRNSGALYTDIG